MPGRSPARKAIVVGAGPVGCLAAMSLARKGWDVEIYEGRPDMRSPSIKAAAQQRSINLAISSRGMAAIHAIDPAAAERFMQTFIPMRGRMIHDIHGNLESQAYDPDGQCINSIDRALLNEGLLEEASAMTNITVQFKHKVQSVDFDRRTMTIRNLDAATDVSVNFDFCVGADGSHSVVRRQLMRVIRMDYHQEYIPHEYIELKMPAGLDSKRNTTFLLDHNHLHIWPRHSFMLIALPNKDKTFTCTLFAPTAEFDRLNTNENILKWFKSYFPDALSAIGEEKLLQDFQRNPRSPLISIKAKPYHYKDCAILLGDAAHAMVPFYGQGLNCGLEDVRVLDTLFQSEAVVSTPPAAQLGAQHFVDVRLSRALNLYSESRHEDLVAICDLAMDNYIEMRHAVTTPAYMLKKNLDNVLFSLTSRRSITLASLAPLLTRVPFPPGEPGGWIPLYTMVTFRPDIGYAKAKRKAEQQSRHLSRIGWLTAAILSVGITWVTLSRHLRYR